MGSGTSHLRSQYEFSHSLDAEDEITSPHRTSGSNRGSFVLEKVDIPSSLLSESGQHRHDYVQPSVLDVPSLSRYPYVDYRFVKKIGNGRFSTVYKGVNLQDNHIKVSTPLKDLSPDSHHSNCIICFWIHIGCNEGNTCERYDKTRISRI